MSIGTAVGGICVSYVNLKSKDQITLKLNKCLGLTSYRLIIMMVDMAELQCMSIYVYTRLKFDGKWLCNIPVTQK